MPSMDSIFRKIYPDTNATYPKYEQASKTRPVTSTTTKMSNYFRSIDGLMNAVLYDKEATIYDTSPIEIFLLGQNLSDSELHSGTTSFAAKVFMLL